MEWISSEDLLRQLVEEHGETHFVFRRITLAWERTAEWVGDIAANAEGEGPIRDVKSKKRCWHASSRMHVCSAHDYTSHWESCKYVHLDSCKYFLSCTCTFELGWRLGLLRPACALLIAYLFLPTYFRLCKYCSDARWCSAGSRGSWLGVKR